MIPDLTQSLNLLLYSPIIHSGATFRSDVKEGDYSSCQYWKPPNLVYMNSRYSRYITGVGEGLWDNSKSCGQCLEVINGNKKVEVVIADYCPPPCTPNQLDLNIQASAALNTHHSEPQNYPKLQVRKLLCNWTRPMEIHLDTGSSEYNWYMIPLFIEQPLKSVKVLEQEAYHDKYGRWVINFKGKYPKKGKNKALIDGKEFEINFI